MQKTNFVLRTSTKLNKLLIKDSQERMVSKNTLVNILLIGYYRENGQWVSKQKEKSVKQ